MYTNLTGIFSYCLNESELANFLWPIFPYNIPLTKNCQGWPQLGFSSHLTSSAQHLGNTGTLLIVFMVTYTWIGMSMSKLHMYIGSGTPHMATRVQAHLVPHFLTYHTSASFICDTVVNIATAEYTIVITELCTWWFYCYDVGAMCMLHIYTLDAS